MLLRINAKTGKISCLLNIFLFIEFIGFSVNYIILPFKTINLREKNFNSNNEDSIENVLSIINNDKIYTSISFGDSSLSIDCYFSMFQYSTSIYENNFYEIELNSLYYNDNSGKNRMIDDFILQSEKCTIYNDVNLTSNITINSFSFYFNQKEKNKENFNKNDNSLNSGYKYCGIIGLSRYPYNFDLNSQNFIYNLKKYNYINSYSFGFFFFEENNLNNNGKNTNENYDGFLIAGAATDDDIDIMDTNIPCSVYAEEGTINWSINFERIFYYEKIKENLEYISTNNTKVEFIIDLNYIISDKIYYQDIKKYYFQKFFDNGTCFEEQSIKNNEYTSMIVCKSNFKENMSSFPSIYFYIEQLFFAFNLNYEDLFYEYNNKIYFLVIRKESINNYWQMGKIFLKKYPLMFDYDKKIVSYVFLKKSWNPKKEIKNKGAFNKNNKDDKIKINKEYSIYFLLIIGIIIGIFIGKRIWNKKKKIKANELEEQYIYFDNQNNNDKN